MSELITPLPRPVRPVLADAVPGLRDRTVLLVISGTLFLAAASQVRIPLGFTPVPINLGTFAAVLVGGALGARRGAASTGLFLAAGIVGLPFFADWNGGWSYFTGATGGYLVCYPVMAALVGFTADRGRDREIVPFVTAVLLANILLYTVGAMWLAQVLGVPMFGSESSAWSLGIRPFLAGDLAKMIAAGLLFPAVWRFVDER